MQRVLVVVSACVVLIATGVVHGVWTDRWSEQRDLVETAKRLDQLPLTVGAWHGTPVEMEKDPNSGLAGMIARRYVHATTGKVVTLYLAVGRAGAVCIHTPEVCYAGSGFEVGKQTKFTPPSTTAEAPPEFWTAHFVRERTSGKTHLRIFWSWHGGDGWKVAENPRLSFAGERTLYKMYLIREMIQAEETIDGDACVEFMHDLLPALEKNVFTESK